MKRATWMLVALLLAQPLAAQTLERIRGSNSLNLGYLPDLAPFSSQQGGEPAGYAVDLCQRVAERVKREQDLAGLQVHYRALARDQVVAALQRGEVDLMCSGLVETLARREQVSFSLPIYPAGRGVMVRNDVSPALVAALNGRAKYNGPQWRATINRGLIRQRFAVIGDSVSEHWVRGKLRLYGVQASVVPVVDYAAGVAAVAQGKADAFFADRVVLQNQVVLSPAADELQVLDRLFELEPLALAMARGDEDFRLLVDRELSLVYRSGEIEPLYRKYFGEPSAQVRLLFQTYSRP
ncbi:MULTISPECIES: amino acid ABC transporter substrate-binding protein [unclassified Pseudomonas]|uniref:amino acid ABC transporter substrate-binding protein n=1 Tax=unclassified Pseudomonas TaxID=196821 RepID=UPI002446EE26|nr:MULTISPECIES: amino acid ABC transporter substrate-binding protein [unclassified Pseudomonas]MDG9924655.1 amino acid ABC transporter substrate-binding protein [Pseudomonas sp. GD04045]MDH0033472.1 amino acid ABC transporter substrate-binding protein [Pseudomonas sp. GD04019]